MALSIDTLRRLQAQLLHRNDELELLNAFITGEPSTSAPTLFIHGYKPCGKTLVVHQFLEQLGVNHSWINCDSILSSKLLMQKCIDSIRRNSGVNYYDDGDGSCDSFPGFVRQLESFIEQYNYTKQHVLVLDRIDQFMEEPITVMKSFDRMRDVAEISNVTVVFISRMELPNSLVTSSVPQIYFRPYTQSQAVEILQKNRFCFFQNDEINNSAAGHLFWKAYCQVIVDLYYDFTGSNITMLVDLARQKWPIFTESIENGHEPEIDFMKVFRDKRGIFQDDSITNCTVIDYHNNRIEESGTLLSLGDMTYTAKFLIIASYLASFIDPKYDVYYFTKSKQVKAKPQKSRSTEITKKDLDSKLLQPNFFDLERLYAILLVIYRNESQSFNSQDDEDLTEEQLLSKQHEIAKFSIASNIDLQSQLATLLAQGLVYRQVTRDILQPRTRWRSNVSFEVVESIAKDVQFPLHNYLN